MKQIFYLVMALALLPAPFFSQDKPATTPLKMKAKKEQIVSRLQEVVPRLMADGIVPGLSVALVQDGALVWHQGYGVKNAQTKEPVTETTMFEAASLSKPVFAYAVLKLVDAGKLDLDIPLTKYLPGNYDVADDARIGLITARHVLSHRPGFPNWRQGGALKIHFTPGERFSYSGEGFVYLAKVVEHITGEKFDDLMKRLVFVPLGMTNSSFVWRDGRETQLAFRHNMIGEPAGQNRSLQANAAASLQTTARDFGTFMVAVLNGTGLKPATRKMMLTPQIQVSESGTNNTERAPEKLSTEISWGLGWGLQTTADGLSLWHWGDNGNAKAYVVAYDKQKFGMVVFTNSANGLSIISELVDEALGGRQPALAWLRYDSYKSPGKTLLKNILAKGAVESLREYRDWRKGRGGAETISENLMNRLGYDLMATRRVKDAIEVFKQNVEDFPQSSNVYDSLGEAYMRDGNKELAIKNYQRSIELDPANTNAIETLKKLKETPDKN